MSTPSYDEVKEQVSRRYNRWAWFVIHVIMAIISIIIIWLIDPTPQDGTPVLAGLWFAVLICHAVKIYLDGLRDQAVERTWQRYSGDGEQEKPKRFLRLEDDDELEVIEDEAAPLNSQMRRG